MNNQTEESHLNPENWINNYSDELFAFAFKRVSKRETALDLVQDTFLSALKAKDNFKGNSSEKTWLYTILRNKIIDHYRKHSKRTTVGIEEKVFDVKGHWQIPDKFFTLSPEDVLNNKELGKIIDGCIGDLPDKTAAAFKLKHIDGEKTEEICKQLDITSSNYWVIMHRARLQLQDCIKKKWSRA